MAGAVGGTNVVLPGEVSPGPVLLTVSVFPVAVLELFAAIEGGVDTVVSLTGVTKFELVIEGFTVFPVTLFAAIEGGLVTEGLSVAAAAGVGVGAVLLWVARSCKSGPCRLRGEVLRVSEVGEGLMIARQWQRASGCIERKELAGELTRKTLCLSNRAFVIKPSSRPQRLALRGSASSAPTSIVISNSRQVVPAFAHPFATKVPDTQRRRPPGSKL